ncbi:hypothetical protein [Streptomyces sp. NBC_00564]|uniref:hypothetical protein n=1 Tax=Streptomyces sp. NBC_00564 TaxID=2903663 RepID=UPI002FCDCB4D|nr:hypothetical protein OG256_46400 [Streptomyces sp. NBC_00564]
MRDPRSALAETLSQVDSFLGEGRSRLDVLAAAGTGVEQLSITTGEPQDVVVALLEGGEAPAEDVTDRIIRRIVHLRETRRRPDGSRRSYDEIAASYNATRASLSNLINSRKKTQVKDGAEQHAGRAGGPLASTTAGIERFFFGAPNGWLSAEPESALNDALQPVLAFLRSSSGSEPYSARRAVALRTAAALPDDKWQLVQGFIETLELQVRRERGLEQ